VNAEINADLAYTTSAFVLSLRRPLAINEESFESLLAWLDPNRETAGQKYEVIRTGLIRIFVSKGFSDAEDLADETINRVMKKLPEIRDTYVGEPVRYFHGVARYIIRETGRRKEVAVDEVPGFSTGPDVHSDEYDCLLKCLRFLPSEKQDLILDYYIYDGRDKIAQHRNMASALGITEGALRGRAHHVRGNLEKCIQQCIERTRANEK
jgi:DNA-directed RNA polymerase specialized sigma24 family protein